MNGSGLDDYSCSVAALRCPINAHALSPPSPPHNLLRSAPPHLCSPLPPPHRKSQSRSDQALAHHSRAVLGPHAPAELVLHSAAGAGVRGRGVRVPGSAGKCRPHTEHGKQVQPVDCACMLACEDRLSCPRGCRRVCCAQVESQGQSLRQLEGTCHTASSTSSSRSSNCHHCKSTPLF